MRQLTEHCVNVANDRLKITVMDEPGAGGACHLYQIDGFNTATNPSCPFVERYGQPSDHASVLFQNGPIGDVGVNGVTHEALLAIIADRLRSFQAGAYANKYNAEALTHIEAAQAALLARTVERRSRGVEGTHEK